FIYYVHDETFLGKALNAFVERMRLILRTILDSSDGSLAGDAFASCCLLLVHLIIPMLLIFLYYGFRLRQIKRGIINDQAYQIKAKKYFGQASVVLFLNLILGLAYFGPDLIGYFKTCPQPAKTKISESKISEPKAPASTPRKKEFEHVYLSEFNLLFSYFTKNNFPITCLSKSNISSLFFASEAKRSIVLNFNPFATENFDNVPDETIYLEVFSKPLMANETPKMLPHYDGRYQRETSLKIDEILSLTGFSINDAAQIQPVCKYRYLPKLPPEEILDSTQNPAVPKIDSDMEPRLSFEKVDLLVFNIPGGWVAFAVQLKMSDAGQLNKEENNLRTPDMDFDAPRLVKPCPKDQEIIGPGQPSDLKCIAPPPLGVDKINHKNYPIITQLRFCTQKEFQALKSVNE
ncbi:MAG: hypothetical protein AB1403_21945, partial [Candidatus Riflebacteria bacterium]